MIYQQKCKWISKSSQIKTLAALFACLEELVQNGHMPIGALQKGLRFSSIIVFYQYIRTGRIVRFGKSVDHRLLTYRHRQQSRQMETIQ
jgi:hypothetical protein